MFSASEIYDPNFADFFSTIIKIICAIAITLTSLLIYIITTKTPPFMSNLKIYLIPYCIYSLIIELVWLLYTPIILHPFVYFYPTGIAKYFHPKIIFVIVGFGSIAAISLLDCCIGILLERSIALKNIEKLASVLPSIIFIPYLNVAINVKIPNFVFALLSLSCFLYLLLIGVALSMESFLALVIVPLRDIPNIVNLYVTGLQDLLNFYILMVFQGADKNSLPLYIFFVGSFAGLRCIASLILIPYNVLKSYQLRSKMLAETKKTNLMLLRMCYFQFTGFSIFLCLPMAIIIFMVLFIPTPNININYCFIVMVCFSIYDTIITILCITPYRIFIFSFFKSQKQVVIIAQSGQ